MPALLALYALGGLTSLVIDLAWILRAARNRKVSPDDEALPPTPEALRERKEKPLAILVPVTSDSSSAVYAIATLLESADYDNYRIFVTLHERHTRTLEQLRRISQVHPKLHVETLPSNAAAEAGCCLNHALRVVRDHEEKYRIPFSVFVVHDIDSDLHPLVLKHFNFRIPEVDMVQIPVFAYADQRASFMKGVAIDQLALRSSREVVARIGLGCAVPSLGTGVALSAEAMQFLQDKHPEKPFNERLPLPGSGIARRLRTFPGRRIFLETQSVARDPRPLSGTGNRRTRGGARPHTGLFHGPSEGPNPARPKYVPVRREFLQPRRSGIQDTGCLCTPLQPPRSPRLYGGRRARRSSPLRTRVRRTNVSPTTLDDRRPRSPRSCCLACGHPFHARQSPLWPLARHFEHPALPADPCGRGLSHAERHSLSPSRRHT